jgi:glycosyltransferase involved in cell wall biosynthesis
VIGLSSKEFLIVIIGQAKKGMAVHEAFEALLQLPSWVHLALVGKNQDQYLEEVVKYELRNRVHLIQPVKPFEVISFIKSADASLIPYYARSVNYENALPNRLFQSIGAELPIFYPELPEIRKLVEAYEIGIPIDPLVPESIVQAAIKLIDNPALRLQYHANVRRAKDDLNWEKEEVILRDLVLKVLKHG